MNGETKKANETILSDFQPRGEKTRKRYRIYVSLEGCDGYFYLWGDHHEKGPSSGRQTPVAICWDFHKLNSLGRHARGVSKLNDNRVSFFSPVSHHRNGNPVPRFRFANSITSLTFIDRFIAARLPRTRVCVRNWKFAALGNIHVNYYNVRTSWRETFPRQVEL